MMQTVRMRTIRWLCALMFGLSAVAQAQALHSVPRADWRSFELPSHTRLEYPAAIFAPAGASARGVGEQFQSRDGQATLSVYAQPNRTGETPVSYLRKNLQTNPSAIQYKRIAQNFFAISMERGGTVYYSRCNFEVGAPGALHCFDLTYPQREKQEWDGIVTRISLSLRPLEP